MSSEQTSTPRKPRAKTQAQTSSLRDLLPLDKGSFEPLYFQIQRQLEQRIRSGLLSVDDALPGEAELSRIFGVSRMTSRQALQALTSSGLAYRERGRGTFVCAPKVEKHIAHLLGFSMEMSLLGLRASTKVLASSIVPATTAVATALELPPASPVMMLHRLRLADGKPVAIEQVWLPYERFPGMEKLNYARNSLYGTLREYFGLRIGSANEVLEARAAKKEEARLLQVPSRSSLLVISRTLLDTEGNPVETGYSLYRSDRYRVVLNVPAIQSIAANGEKSRRAEGELPA